MFFSWIILSFFVFLFKIKNKENDSERNVGIIDKSPVSVNSPTAGSQCPTG